MGGAGVMRRHRILAIYLAAICVMSLALAFCFWLTEQMANKQ